MKISNGVKTKILIFLFGIVFGARGMFLYYHLFQLPKILMAPGPGEEMIIGILDLSSEPPKIITKEKTYEISGPSSVELRKIFSDKTEIEAVGKISDSKILNSRISRSK
jgi:hypothetical protein